MVWYYSYFGNNQYTHQLAALFLFGVLLHFFQKIEPGTYAELVFFGKARNFFWEDGYCFVPSFLPILHHFGIYLLWSLKKAITEPLYRNDRDVSIEHFQDQRRPVYNMNTQTTLLGMAVSRVIEGVFGWFFGIKRGDPELLFQRLGGRIIILAIIFGIIANTFFPNGGTKQPWNETLQAAVLASTAPTTSKDPSTSNTPGTIFASSQLRKGIQPTMPLPERFIPQTIRDKEQHFFLVDEADPRKYLFFHDPPTGKDASVYVDESLCVVIPAGRELFFITKYRPTFEVNMEKTVRFQTKYEKHNFIDKVRMYLLAKQPEEETASWAYVHDYWDTVDTSTYSIKARALPEAKIRGSEEGYGGLVCF